jgi:NitT/TauT family transport system permease protein
MARIDRKRLKKFGLVLACLAFWLAVWTACSLWVGLELFLPTPWAVLQSLWDLLPRADFWTTVGKSFLRVVQGYLPAVLLGALGGIVTAKVRVLDILFAPLLTVIRATPVSSFIMLIFMLLGRDSTPAFIVFLMVLPIVWANVAQGVKTVDPSLKEVCRLYRIPTGRRWKVLYLPHCLPYFSAGALTSLGLAWKAGIAAEVLCTPNHSIGKQVYDAKVYMETAEVFAWTLVVILLSLALEKLLKHCLERRDRR